MPPGTQRHQRTKMVLPLRIWIDEQNAGQNADGAVSQLAHTVDISPVGGRLGGLRIAVKPGETILIQRGQQKAQFRVVWAKEMGPGEIQAGVESLDSERKIWGLELVEQAQSANNSVGAPEFSPASREVVKKASPTTRPAPSRLRSAFSLDSQIRWIAVIGVFLVAIASIIFMQRKPEPPEAQVIRGISPAASKPETEAEARPRTNERTFTFIKDEPAGADPLPRVRVAEAPEGHPIYPISPDPNVSGHVDLKILTAADGRVKQIEVISGKQILAEAAVRAAKLWRYAPQKLNGQPAEAETSAVVQFRAGDAVSIHFPSETVKPAESN
jgi:outer membrane biosynthesis protein TonB